MSQDQGASADADRAGGASPLSPQEGSQPKALVPSAGADEESYRMNPQFRRFVNALGGDVVIASVAWGVAQAVFAPSDPHGDAELEVWQGDEMVAGCSGPRGRAMAEAVHYAVVYQTDEKPCTIMEVTRREITPDLAHAILASAMSAGTAETAKQAQGEARQRDGNEDCRDAQKDLGITEYNSTGYGNGSVRR